MTPIDRFQSEYLDYHEISEGRRTEQVNVIRALSRFAGKEPHKCSASDVKQYLASEQKKGQHVNTIRKKLNMLKPYFAWAWEARLIDAQTLMEVRAVNPPRGASGQGLPKPYTRKELDQFRAALDKAWPTVEQKFWDRWRRGTTPYRRVQPHFMRIQVEAIVALALQCGLRRQEIFHASIDDIHYDNAYVVVQHGKDGRIREVPHTEQSREAVRRWLELRAELKPKHDSVWLSLAWDSVKTHPMMWDRFRKLLHTIPGGWQLHRFRHTCGTEWLRATKRIEIVSRLLGHSRIQQTLVYAAIIPDDLHQAITKAEDAFSAAVG